MGYKGTWRRPAQVTEAELRANWMRTFGIPASHLTDDGYILTDFAVNGIRKRCSEATDRAPRPRRATEPPAPTTEAQSDLEWQDEAL